MNDELERLMREATPGPWFIARNANTVGDCTPEDAALIVAAVNALPELLERVRRLEAALRLFLEDDRFHVSVGGNPIAIEQMIGQARAALNQEPTHE